MNTSRTVGSVNMQGILFIVLVCSRDVYMVGHQYRNEQDLVFSVKLHFKKKLVKEGCFSPKCFGIKQDLGLKCSAWKVFDSKD